MEKFQEFLGGCEKRSEVLKLIDDKRQAAALAAEERARVIEEKL